jgi:hypothetical protein
MRPTADSAADGDPLTRVLAHRRRPVEEHPWTQSASNQILPRPAERLIGAEIRKLAVVAARIDGMP